MNKNSLGNSKIVGMAFSMALLCGTSFTTSASAAGENGWCCPYDKSQPCHDRRGMSFNQSCGKWPNTYYSPTNVNQAAAAPAAPAIPPAAAPKPKAAPVAPKPKADPTSEATKQAVHQEENKINAQYKKWHLNERSFKEAWDKLTGAQQSSLQSQVPAFGDAFHAADTSHHRYTSSVDAYFAHPSQTTYNAVEAASAKATHDIQAAQQALGTLQQKLNEVAKSSRSRSSSPTTPPKSPAAGPAPHEADPTSEATREAVRQEYTKVEKEYASLQHTQLGLSPILAKLTDTQRLQLKNHVSAFGTAWHAAEDSDHHYTSSLDAYRAHPSQDTYNAVKTASAKVTRDIQAAQQAWEKLQQKLNEGAKPSPRSRSTSPTPPRSPAAASGSGGGTTGSGR